MEFPLKERSRTPDFKMSAQTMNKDYLFVYTVYSYLECYICS